MLHYRIDTKVWQHVCILFLLLSFLFEIFPTQTAFKRLIFFTLPTIFHHFCCPSVVVADFLLGVHSFSGEKLCVSQNNELHPFILEHAPYFVRVFVHSFSIWWSATVCVCVLCWYTKYKYLHRVPFSANESTQWKLWKPICVNMVYAMQLANIISFHAVSIECDKFVWSDRRHDRVSSLCKPCILHRATESNYLVSVTWVSSSQRQDYCSDKYIWNEFSKTRCAPNGWGGGLDDFVCQTWNGKCEASNLSLLWAKHPFPAHKYVYQLTNCDVEWTWIIFRLMDRT